MRFLPCVSARAASARAVRRVTTRLPSTASRRRPRRVESDGRFRADLVSARSAAITHAARSVHPASKERKHPRAFFFSVGIRRPLCRLGAAMRKHWSGSVVVGCVAATGAETRRQRGGFDEPGVAWLRISTRTRRTTRPRSRPTARSSFCDPPVPMQRCDGGGFLRRRITTCRPGPNGSRARLAEPGTGPSRIGRRGTIRRRPRKIACRRATTRGSIACWPRVAARCVSSRCNSVRLVGARIDAAKLVRR